MCTMQTEKGPAKMVGKRPCKEQGKETDHNGYLEKRRQDIEI